MKISTLMEDLGKWLGDNGQDMQIHLDRTAFRDSINNGTFFIEIVPRVIAGERVLSIREKTKHGGM